MQRISGITYLKAFLPLLVIACHARPFGQSSSMVLPLQGVPDWKDIFFSNVLCLAVPLFFIITFYLYLLKRTRVQGSVFKLLCKRVLYFLLLFVCWRIIYVVLSGGGSLWFPDKGIAQNLYHWIFGGGYTLLYYLEQAAYFLIVLELICFICERIKLSKTVVAVIGLALSVLLIVFCNWFAPESVKIEALRFFSPIGFLPYIFIALLLNEININNKTAKIYIFLAAIIFGISLSIVEWMVLPNPVFLENGYSIAIPTYPRISLVFSSFGIIGLFFQIKKKPSKLTETMSSISLDVYCIHPISISIVVWITGDALNGLDFLAYLLVVLITYALSVGLYYAKKLLGMTKAR